MLLIRMREERGEEKNKKNKKTYTNNQAKTLKFCHRT